MHSNDATYPICSIVTDMDSHKVKVLKEAGDIINELLHSEIDHLTNDKLANQLSQFSIDQCINKTNQLLWKFLECATQTRRERTSSSISGGDNERTIYKKRIRCFYILCLMMYSTNSRKPTPLHTLLADTIEMCGGSRLLIKILNQLGAVASTDTHDRFVTAVAENQREKSVWDYLPDNVFTIASADNFDMLQSHAAVYCGDRSRSYHGTTVQIVQPDPKLVCNTHIHKGDSQEQENHTHLQSFPTSSHQETQPVTPMFTSSIRESQTVAPIPTSSIRETQPVTPMLTSSIRESQTVAPIPTSSIRETQPVTPIPPTSSHQETQPVTPMLTSFIRESQTVTPIPTSSIRESQTVTPIPTSSIRESQTVTPIPTSSHRPDIHSHTSRWDIPIASKGCSTQAMLTVLDRDSCHTIAVDGPTPTSLIAAKRRERSSPASSPHKLGKIGPKRRRTLVARNIADLFSKRSKSRSPLEPFTTPTATTITLEGFAEDSNEKTVRQSLETKAFAYMLSKHVLYLKASGDGILKEFKEFFSQGNDSTETEPSNIYYMELLDENPDSSDTMKHLAEILLETTSSVHQDRYVVLVGDGKTYEHLMQIKRMYGSELQKLLIFPGDWHTLKNYQPVLMKIYYPTGLKELAKASGFRAETLTSLEKCTNFKRTHQFLLQAWQSIYRQMINTYLNHNKDTCPQLIVQLHSIFHSEVTPTEMLVTVEELLTNAGQYEKFQAFIHRLSKIDDTWKFWEQFVFKDCLAYIGLFLSIRCCKWKLRVARSKANGPSIHSI